MVMCRGDVDRGPTPRYTATLVYFPSQDAISASAIPQGVTMWAPGAKRKREPEDGDAAYFNQRQSILDISMIKLRTQPVRRTEPPLRRSVLIFNTLKTIETELTLEGVRWNLPTRPSLLPAIQRNDLTLDPIPDTDTKPAIDRSTHSAMDTSCRSPLAMSNTTVTPAAPVTSQEVTSPETYTDSRCILDSFFSLGASQAGPLPTFSSLLDLDSHNTSYSTTHSTHTSTGYSTSHTQSSSALSSSAAASPHLPISSSSSTSSSSSSSQSSSCPQQQHSVSRPLPSYDMTCSNHAPAQHCPLVSSSPSSTDHDLFSDFDFSSLDVDLFSVIQSKLPPLSAEDLQSLPITDSFSQSRSASCNPKHSDLLGEDLDSIMQILVGI